MHGHLLECWNMELTYVSYLLYFHFWPQNISISYEDTDVVDDSGGGYPPVDEDPGQVLGDVHGCHVDKHLDIIRVSPRVQDVDLAPGHCGQGKPANEIAFCLEKDFRK